MGEVVIYGMMMSQPTRSVLIFCELSQIPYKLEETNIMAGDNFRRPFRKINPNAQIPALTYQNFNLWESAAMIQYLSDKFSTDNSWFPKNPETRARILSYLHWHHENIRRPIVNYLRKKIFFPMLMGKPEPSVEQERKLKEKALGVCKDLDWVLEETGFVARTSGPTIADVFAFNEVVSGYLTGIRIDGSERVKRWFERIAQVPEVQRVSGSVIKECRDAWASPKL